MVSTREPVSTPVKPKSGWFVSGGVLGALLTSSCCLGPLILITLGASGAWIGNLGVLKAYQPVFVGIAILFLAISFWLIYRPRQVVCDENGYCANPQSQWLLKTILWLTTLLVIVAVTVDYWAPLFYKRRTLCKS